MQMPVTNFEMALPPPKVNEGEQRRELSRTRAIKHSQAPKRMGR